MESKTSLNELKSWPVLTQDQIRKMRVPELQRAIQRNHRIMIRLIVQACRLMEADDLLNVAQYAVSVCREMI